MSTEIFALIKKSSDYYRQQHTDGKYFPVTFEQDGLTGLHIVRGNQNRYRVSDLNFFVRIADRFVRLK